jgi:hypothetical protein
MEVDGGASSGLEGLALGPEESLSTEGQVAFDGTVGQDPGAHASPVHPADAPDPPPRAHRTSATSSGSNPQPRRRGGPKLGSKDPIHEIFICHMPNVVELVVEVQQHAKACTASTGLGFQRRQLKTRGLAGLARLQCPLGSRCPYLRARTCSSKLWSSAGVLRWQSCEDFALSEAEVGPEQDGQQVQSPRVVPVVNGMFAFATTICPVTKKHADDLCRAMGLNPPCRNTTQRIANDGGILSYISDEKARIVEAQCAKLREKDALLVCMDTGHSSARHSQNAVVFVGCDGEAVLSCVDTESPAAQKEGNLMQLALDELIYGHNLDIAAVVIDHNVANEKRISGYTRVNARNPELRTAPVLVKNDIYHTASNMGKNAIKSAGEFHELLRKRVIASCQRPGWGESDLRTDLDELMSDLMQPSDEFFKDIEVAFEELPAHTWQEVCSSAQSMRDLANQLRLVEVPLIECEWTTVVSAWNGTVGASNKVTSVQHISPSKVKSASKRTLLAMAEALEDITGQGRPSEEPFDKGETITYCVQSLPLRSRQGYCYSVSFASLCSEKAATTTSPASTPPAAAASNSGRAPPSAPARTKAKPKGTAAPAPAPTVQSIFAGQGGKPTLTATKKLSVEGLRQLRDLIDGAHEEIIDKIPPTNCSRAVLQQFCVRNLWVVQEVQEDALAALSLAHRSFLTQIPSLKRHVKRLEIAISQSFGCFSTKFKMYVLLHGMLNFAQHYCDDHEHCARFVWWSSCTRGAQFYQPSQPYCTSLTSLRGQRCNALIAPFFRLLVTAWVVSPYVESRQWPSVDYLGTHLCESYFHSVGVNIPKWTNSTPPEFKMKEAVTFTATFKRQQRRQLQAKVLRGNKNAAGLIAVAGQKVGRDEPHVLDGLDSLFGTVPAVAATVGKRRAHCDRQHGARANLIQRRTEAQSQDPVAQNLRVGNVHLSEKTSSMDGVLCGVQLADPEQSARPVTPFPFRPEELLTEEQQELLLHEVWRSAQRGGMRPNVPSMNAAPAVPGAADTGDGGEESGDGSASDVEDEDEF